MKIKNRKKNDRWAFVGKEVPLHKLGTHPGKEGRPWLKTK